MLPKFSIRQLLWLMVVIGFFSLCLSSAARGNHVAYGFSLAVIGSVVPLSIYALVHWSSFWIASFVHLAGKHSEVNSVDRPVVTAGAASESVVVSAPAGQPVNKPIDPQASADDGGEDA